MTTIPETCGSLGGHVCDAAPTTPVWTTDARLVTLCAECAEVAVALGLASLPAALAQAGVR